MFVYVSRANPAELNSLVAVTVFYQPLFFSHEMISFASGVPVPRLPKLRPMPFCRTPFPVRLVSRSSLSSSVKRVVFLGTPAVAASSLKRIWDASQTLRATEASPQFEIVAVVTQPPAPIGRKRVLTPSPVHALAEALGIEPVLTPASARDEIFLGALRELRPHLCVTAAYGNFLPQSFLDIPSLGTLNIHPSLLPKFRGAAPVPRALEEGVSETGVSVAFTELKMDSGPIVGQHRVQLDGSEQSPELLQSLFDIGSDVLISALPSVFTGEAASSAVKQDDQYQTHAPKLSKHEARLSFTENASRTHNKIRAFAGWPGTWAEFVVTDESTSEKHELVLKVLRSQVLRCEGGMCFGVHDVKLSECGKMLAVVCDDGSMLGLSIIQPPGKKAMDARSFWNGLRGKRLERKRVPH